MILPSTLSSKCQTFYLCFSYKCSSDLCLRAPVAITDIRFNRSPTINSVPTYNNSVYIFTTYFLHMSPTSESVFQAHICFHVGAACPSRVFCACSYSAYIRILCGLCTEYEMQWCLCRHGSPAISLNGIFFIKFYEYIYCESTLSYCANYLVSYIMDYFNAYSR
jgi:hypothetical protein